MLAGSGLQSPRWRAVGATHSLQHTRLLQVPPLQRLENCPALAYEPVVCRSCPCVLNPYCGADFGARAWRCPLW